MSKVRVTVSIDVDVEDPDVEMGMLDPSVVVGGDVYEGYIVAFDVETLPEPRGGEQ